MIQYLIIGGGISGLYCAYSLHKYLNISNVIIIEKTNRLGGRVYTKYIDQDTYLEMCASRIASTHHNALNLIKELDLGHKLQHGNSGRSHATTTLAPNEDKTDFATYKINKIASLNQTDFYDIINEITYRLTDIEFYKTAMDYSLFRLIEKYYGIVKATEMRNQFGYDGDFMEQNAIDGIHMFNTSFGKTTTFSGLNGGLSQIIAKLVEYLNANSINIHMNTECIDITKNGSYYECITKDGTADNNSSTLMVPQTVTKFSTNNIIFAIPKTNLIKINYLSPIQNQMNSVVRKALCRLYLFFPKENNKIWFGHLPRVLTTDTLLRQIVPIDEQKGIIMFYTDSDSAKTWHYLKKHNILLKELMQHLRGLFGNIPDPIKMYDNYHDTATHVWRPTVNSRMVSEFMIKPFVNESIYIVGEAYSMTQQWIEGALITVNNLISRIKIEQKH